ncbi:MAG: heme-binding protein, partial [Pontimonas sp.]
ASKAEQKLLSALASAGKHVSGGVFFARYDPPMTPIFLRRNEALVEIS